MDYTIEHDLSPELAREAAKQASEHYCDKFAKYDAKTVWSDPDNAQISFCVKGVDVAASVELLPGKVAVDMVKVPLLLRPFKNMALESVQKTMGKWIEKAKNGEIQLPESESA